MLQIKKIYLGFLSIIPFSIISCQTYTNENNNIREEMYAGNFTKATNDLDNSSISSQDRNYALFRMEKGMLLYLSRQYDPATQLWIQADKRLDDLYTTSITRSALSFVINDSMSDYDGEAHERILIPIFTSLAFFASNNLNNAQVMIRRIYDIMNALKHENEGKNTFKYDLFSYYFSGMVFEAKNDWDNALVEYRAALSLIINQISLKEKINSQAKSEILKATGRIAEFRNRNDILAEVRKIDPKVTWVKQSELLKKGEAYIIYECGKSPIKIPEDIVIPVGKTIARISFPKYEVIPYSSHYADVYVGNKFRARTVVMENIGQMAELALSDRRVKDIAKMTARVVAKNIAAQKLNDENPLAGLAAGVFNVVTEVADTRSWTTLPDNIQIARVVVEPGHEVNFEIRPQVGNPEKFAIKLSAGEKKLYRFRTFN